jgi:capsular polysaccharide export protein
MPSGRSWRSPGLEVGATGKVVIYSPGLWRLRHEVAALSGLDPVRGARWRALPGDATIAGWGHKPTADYAMAMAAKHDRAYLAIEDGWLRSVRPGSAEPPSSLVLDRSGIYYDARGPSDLEAMLESANGPTPAEQADAESVIDLLRRHRLSKYNEAPPEDDISEIKRSAAGLVLVADQTFGDASIAGGLADAESFRHMVEAAVAENPEARVIVKLHPEVSSGRKRGYLAALALPEGCTVLSRRVNPWALLERVDKVYTVSSQLGFEALMAGRPVVCFGMPFYAGWGLTDDRAACPRRTNRVSLARLVHAAFFGYCRYLDAWRRHETDVFTAADQLLFLRQRFLANSRPVTGFRVSAWKRRAVRAFLDGPGPIGFTRNLEAAIANARAQDGAVAAWGATAGRIAGEVREAGIDLMTIEDGFLRSVGLGASFTPAMSYVFDSSGIYYDPSRPSDLEVILQSTEFDAALVERARALIAILIERQLTKYNPAAGTFALQPPAGREIVLVPGQVADDAAVCLGGADLYEAEPMEQGGANLTLLKRVRARRPDAFIIFRPHPDVAAGLRSGHVPERLARQSADHIDTGPSILATMEVADRVETVTSLAGFEALVRGKPVTVHGQPFYSGWGLTEDLRPLPRRSRRLTIEELVAGVLIVYPRYFDPVSGRVCPVEVAVERLAHMRKQGPGVSAWLRLRAGHAIARSRHLLIRRQNLPRSK